MTGQDGIRGWRGQARFGERMKQGSDLLPFLNLSPAPSSFSLSHLPPYSFPADQTSSLCLISPSASSPPPLPLLWASHPLVPDSLLSPARASLLWSAPCLTASLLPVFQVA